LASLLVSIGPERVALMKSLDEKEFLQIML